MGSWGEPRAHDHWTLKKSCPACRSRCVSTYNVEGMGRFFVRCFSCRLQGPEAATEEVAAAEWNRLLELAQKADENAGLADMLRDATATARAYEADFYRQQATAEKLAEEVDTFRRLGTELARCRELEARLVKMEEENVFLHSLIDKAVAHARCVVNSPFWKAWLREVGA